MRKRREGELSSVVRIVLLQAGQVGESVSQIATGVGTAAVELVAAAAEEVVVVDGAGSKGERSRAPATREFVNAVPTVDLR